MASTPARLDAFGSRLGHEWIERGIGARWREVDGTLGFFDVSGYTRLTERLARLGPAGAEAITTIANALFEGLISAAFAHGGDVLQFSGDAVLVHFTGDGHAARATRAGVAMQHFIRDHGGITTELGPVRLRMSVGMHAGPATFALLGEDQRVVLALGEHVSAALAAEKEANAGEILVSAPTASALDPAWLGPPRAGMVRIGRVRSEDPAPLDPAILRPSVPAEAAQAFVPVPLRSLLAAGALPGEHRQLSLAFIGVRDLDGLVARHGAAIAVDRLHALAVELERAQAEYDLVWVGADALPGGADFVLVAGTPVAHEDDEDRILLACRELIDADLGLDLAIGVNRGRNFTGVVGHRWRSTYSISGDATNLAARIMAHATPGQLLVHAPLMDRVRSVARTRDQDPFMAKGKRLPVSVVDVEGLQVAGDLQDGESEMFGRDTELVDLGAVVDRSLAGEAGAVAVSGPAGIGKSRLLRALRGSRTSVDWIRVAGEPYASTRALMPIGRLVRRLIGIDGSADGPTAIEALERTVAARAEDLRPWLPLVAPIVGATLAPTPETERLHPDFVAEQRDAVVAELVRACVDGPTVLVFEDLQWFDDASLAVVGRIARTTASTSIAVVLVRRDDGPDPYEDLDGLVRLELGPLDRDASTEVLVAAAGGVAIPEHLVRELVPRAGGNPFFLRELAAATAEGATDAMPESVERLLAARIDRLHHRDRILLREASVAGDPVDLSLLAEALDRPELIDPRTWRGTRGLAEVRGGILRFHSDLVRAAAYDGLAYARRREVHARIAATLAASAGAAAHASELAPVIARHWTAAQVWEDAWVWGRAAVDAAVARSAVSEAHALARGALAAARRMPTLAPEDLAAMVETAGDLAYRIGLVDEAHTAYADARRLLAADPLATARLARKRGELAGKEGRYSQSLRWMRRGLRAIEDLPETPARREIDTELRLALAGTFQQQDRIAAFRDTTLAVLPEAQVLGGALLAQTYLQLATATAFLERIDGEPYASAAERIIAEQGDEFRLGCLHLNLGVAAVDANEFASALARYPDAESAFERCGDEVGAALAVHNRGEVLGILGRDGAVACYTHAVRRFRASGFALGEYLSTSGLGRWLAFDGEIDRGRGLLEDARDGFVRIRHLAFELETELRLVEVDLLSGDVAGAERALAVIEPRLAGLERAGVLPVWLDRLRAVVMARSGHPDAADALLVDVIDRARDAGFVLERVAALDARSRIPGPPSATKRRVSEERDELAHELGIDRLLTV